MGDFYSLAGPKKTNQPNVFNYLITLAAALDGGLNG